jgi:hypothetical protein
MRYAITLREATLGEEIDIRMGVPLDREPTFPPGYDPIIFTLGDDASRDYRDAFDMGAIVHRHGIPCRVLNIVRL